MALRGTASSGGDCDGLDGLFWSRRWLIVALVGSHVNQMVLPSTGRWGLVFVLGNVLLSQLGLPIPAEPTLIFAGATVFERPIAAIALGLGAVLACVLADVAWFLAGRHFGSRIPQLLCRISFTPDICASEAQARFDSWGPNALIVAKFIPGISLLASPLAGALKMRWRTFLVRTTLASALWVGAFLGGGYLFSRQIRKLIPSVVALKPIAVPCLATIAVLYVAYKWRERRRLYAAMNASRVSVADIRVMLDNQEAPVIVDVRSCTARLLDPWQIPNSVHIVPGEIMKRVQDLPANRDIILYCTCPGDASAAQVAGLLIRGGRPKARTLHGGLAAWREAGLAVQSTMS